MPERIGPYLVEEKLGAGSMGVVYRVRDPEQDKVYALKLVRPDLIRPQDLARFRREIELLSAVSDHPNFVRVHSSVDEGGRLGYVMELVQGEDLEHRLRRGPLPPRQAARYVRDIARAVQTLHQRDIVHRDIKPANLLVDDKDVPRLMDFGLARSLGDDGDGRLTQAGELIGTPYYMAPEQAFRREAGPASDVYALGMVLYALLAGEPAVAGATTREVLTGIRNGAHRPLQQLNPDVPKPLVEVCLRALAMDPRVRPSAAGLADELDAWLRDPERGPGAPQGPGARKLGLAALGAGVLVALLAGALLLGRREPLEPLLAQASAALPGRDATALSALRLRLEQALREGDPPHAKRTLAWLQAREGQLRLLAGDAAGARERLQAAEATLGAASDARGELAILRAGLVAVDPGQDDDPRAALRSLERARRDEALDRPEQTAWEIRLALAAGEQHAALSLAELRPDELDPDLRCEVFLAADRPELAAPLLDELSPELRARALWRLGEVALEARDLAQALRHLEPAAALAPDPPVRPRLAELAQAAYARRSRWRRGVDPEALGVAVREEVQAARLVKLLQPGFQLGRDRIDALYRALVEGGTALEAEVVDVVADLITVAPEDLSLHRLFASLVVDWHVPRPERDLALLRSGLERAGPAGPVRRHLLLQLARALQLSGREREVVALAEGTSEADEPGLRAALAARAGAALTALSQLEEAGKWLDRAAELDPRTEDLVLFRAQWHRVRHQRHGDPGDRERALELAWDYLRRTPGAGARPEAQLGELLPWMSRSEQDLGHPERAIEALDLLLRFDPDALRWATRRLILVAERQPLSIQELNSGLDQLQAQTRDLADRLEARARRAGQNWDRRRLRGQADALRALDLAPLRLKALNGDGAAVAAGLGAVESWLSQFEETP